jgi:hypothetical protein
LITGRSMRHGDQYASVAPHDSIATAARIA